MAVEHIPLSIESVEAQSRNFLTIIGEDIVAHNLKSVACEEEDSVFFNLCHYLILMGLKLFNYQLLSIFGHRTHVDKVDLLLKELKLVVKMSFDKLSLREGLFEIFNGSHITKEVAKLREKAEEDDRSLSQYINLILKKNLEEQTRKRSENPPTV